MTKILSKISEQFKGSRYRCVFLFLGLSFEDSTLLTMTAMFDVYLAAKVPY